MLSTLGLSLCHLKRVWHERVTFFVDGGKWGKVWLTSIKRKFVSTQPSMNIYQFIFYFGFKDFLCL